MNLRNFDIENLKAQDNAHHLHPFTNHKALVENGAARVIVRAQGCWIYDASGEKLLDGMAGLWCVNIGYGRSELANIATEQMNTLSYYNTFFKTSTVPTIELSSKLADLFQNGIDHFFFSCSGSEAVDSMMRIVWRYWQAKGQSERNVIIARKNAYHGSTVAGANLGGMAGMHEQLGTSISSIEHIDQPYYFESQLDLDEHAFGLEAASWLETKILEIGPHKIAAFIGEPIQGAGGVIIPPKSYWPEIQKICNKYNILLISDEVICGFGRTGEWFGHQTFGFDPDIVTMAKGISSGYLPVSAVGVKHHVAQTMIEDDKEFTHGFTYSGHPVGCAVALKNIQILEDEKLVTHTKKITGPYLAQALKGLNEHPLVGEIRSLGLIGAFEIVQNKLTRARFNPSGSAGVIVRDRIIANGALLRACGDTIVLSPPLTITDSEIDQLISIIFKSLDEAQNILEIV